MRSAAATIITAALAIIIACQAIAETYPKPSPVPYRWELDFDMGDLRLYIDESTGDAYWYLTYMVTNDTGKDRIWAPEFTLFSDFGGIAVSGDEVPRRVMLDIQELLGNDLLELDLIGDLYQSEENAKEGLVVWRATSLEVTEMSVFVAGISGETARVRNPISGDIVLMRKTLQRDYLVPGDPMARGSDPAQVVEDRWILR